MRARLSIALPCALIACSGSDSPSDGVMRERVALVPVESRRNVDILYVIDDSTSVLHVQQSLKDAFPAFVAELAHDSLPSMHIGVVTSDLGVLAAYDAQPGAPIGSGPGSCSGIGRDGALQTNDTTLVAGSFLVDVDNGDGTRTKNYTGELTNAFAAIASVGSSGCAFEQPLEAMLRSLDSHPRNVGFLRADAALAIIPLQDEDDCSMAHVTLADAGNTTLGPLQSFRCTRFGVRCDEGGQTSDEMNALGMKSSCRWSEDETYLTPRARYESFLRVIKPDPRDVLFMPIAAGRSSLAVEGRTPPGGGTAIPALVHACAWNEPNGPAVADPAVRMEELTKHVARGRMLDVCTADLVPASLAVAREIRGMLGVPCLTREIALPADCEVRDEAPASMQVLPACSTSVTTDCYRLVEDEACTTTHHLRVEVVRSTVPAADTMVAVRCRIER